jgi:hypothetical protein
MTSVAATVDVGVAPDEAFAVFTGEIGAWYVVDERTVPDFPRTRTVRLEPGVGGRLLALRDDETGTELGRVTAWEPGVQLTFTDREGTEVQVTFTAHRGGTRVVLEHRGLERIAPERRAQAGRFGWRLLAHWYQDHLRERTP